MDVRYLEFVGADPDFYDTEWEDKDEAQPLFVDAPAGTVITSAGPWRHYHVPGVDLPDSGWKVHVSCRPERAAEVVPRVVALCLGLSITCKHLRTVRLVASTQAKYATPTAAGKVITAYPKDEAELTALVQTLSDALAGEPGARVLGDIPVDGTPISIRYGAFAPAWYVDETGRTRAGRRAGDQVVPDDRTTSDPSPDERPSPLAEHLRQAARARQATWRLDITDPRLLHRSNAGGVYAARLSDGRNVVLKEARHHTGFDLAGSDAVTRLRHEHAALTRLSGTGVAPEPLDYLTVGDSDFLVMEAIDGTCLRDVLVTRHPAVAFGADRADYRQWRSRVLDGVAMAVSVLHAHGVVHGDLHVGNVFDAPAGVVLLDFESAAIDGVAVAKGVTTTLAGVVDRVEQATDLTALDDLAALLLNPLHSLTEHRPDLADELAREGRQYLGASRRQSERSPELTLGACDPGRLVAGIHLSATPERQDRLFPGDITALATPGGAMGLLHGAAGVLLALHSCGADADPPWLDWLEQRASDQTLWTAGLGDGVEGVAMALALLGRHDAAGALIDRQGGRLLRVPWWGAGIAGQAVAYAELGAALGRSDLTHVARDMCDVVRATIDDPCRVPGYSAGLLDGWSGVALALLRVAELLEVSSAQGGASPYGVCEVDGMRAAAVSCVLRESEVAQWREGALLTPMDRRSMPHVGHGACGVGLAAHAVLPYAGAEDARVLHDLIRGVVLTTQADAVACAGLLHGRSGLILTLDRLDPGSEVVGRHRRRLGWYTVPAMRSGRRRNPRAEAADLVLGAQNLRCSADLATGAAGVLVATVAGSRDEQDPLSRILRMPSACS